MKFLALLLLAPTLVLASPKDPFPQEFKDSFMPDCLEKGVNHDLDPKLAEKYCTCFYDDLSTRVDWTPFYLALLGQDYDTLMSAAKPSRVKCKPLIGLKEEDEPLKI